MQLAEAEASTKRAEQAEEVVQASRYGATVGWCQDVQAVLAALSGVTVLRFEEGCIAVRLLTSFHASWEPTGMPQHWHNLHVLFWCSFCLSP